jgi:hypothetical protein
VKRLFALLLLLALGVTSVTPASAARKVVHRGKGGNGRTVVVVHRGWPLRRPARTVFVRPARTVVTVRPAVYLAPVLFAGVIVSSAPRHDVLVWEDGETLLEDQDWTEFTMRADSRGTRLWFQVVGGRVQVDWAEVVFENGECRVVDFRERSYSPGMYSMADFANGRRVDHVRMVARSRASEARVVLRMQK